MEPVHSLPHREQIRIPHPTPARPYPRVPCGIRFGASSGEPRGARMGRATHTGWNDPRAMLRGDEAPAEASVRFYLRRVKVNAEGYDAGGAYWGVSRSPLFWAYCRETGAEVWTRAEDRDAAKAAVRGRFPRATFHR